MCCLFFKLGYLNSNNLKPLKFKQCEGSAARTKSTEEWLVKNSRHQVIN